MKTNELRIGSYYNYDGDSIKLDGSTLASYLQNDTDLYLYPIPLTEEWLLKFGFKKGIKGWFKTMDKNLKFNLYMYDRATYKNVHQLQNLYFALTNEELKND